MADYLYSTAIRYSTKENSFGIKKPDLTTCSVAYYFRNTCLLFLALSPFHYCQGILLELLEVL
jgi:hypothetical protein